MSPVRNRSTLEKLYRTVDKQDDNVWSLDIDRLVCPYLPICDPIINHHIVTIDGAHLTATFSSTLEQPIAELFRSNGILPRLMRPKRSALSCGPRRRR